MHDLMCPAATVEDQNSYTARATCLCALLRRVREDERARIAEEIDYCINGCDEIAAGTSPN